MPVTVHVVNAFVEDDGTGGNPAGVVLDARGLSPGERQRVAAAAGFSETAYVDPSERADVRLEFYTPVRRVPHCGHATVAAFALLAARGLVPEPESSNETDDGVRRILLSGGEVSLEQMPPVIRPAPERQAIAAALGLEEEDFLAGSSASVASSGLPFVLVPVADGARLRKIKPQRSALIDLGRRAEAVGFYVFALETEKTGRDAAARMFAPAAGIEEEAATGMAAGPLACHLREGLGVKSDFLIIEQGRFMSPPSPSRIAVRLLLEQGRISSLLVSGRARIRETLSV